MVNVGGFRHNHNSTMPPLVELNPLTFRGKHWCFTDNNPVSMVITDIFPANSVEYAVFQHEQGDSDDNEGTPHLQGYVNFAKALRIRQCLKFLPHAHWTPTRDIPASREYCMKEETRLDGPWEIGVFSAVSQGKRTDLDNAVAALKNGGMKRVIDEHPVAFVKFTSGLRALERALREKPRDLDFVPRPWQQRLLDMLEAPANDRAIVWVTDPPGKVGKSVLANYLLKEKGATILQGRLLDMAYIYQSEPIVVFDLSRTQAENCKHLYQFAEELKNGRVVSTKYEPEIKFFKPPHVVFFANFSYDRDAWSADRVVELDSNDPGFNRAYVPPVVVAAEIDVIDLSQDELEIDDPHLPYVHPALSFM